MHLELRTLLPAWTILLTATGCTSGSSEAFIRPTSNTTFGQEGGSSSSSNDSPSTGSTAKTEATSNTESSGGAEDSSRLAAGGSSAGGKSASATARTTAGGSAKGGTGGTGVKGGATGMGGTGAKAGSSSMGGTSATVTKSGTGADSAGGNAETGGGDAGGAESGGAANTICAWEDGPTATNGRMTCYWFSQGTSKDEKACPAGYKTYCGYCGKETGEKPQGEGQNWCPINDIANTVENISTVHFAAIRPSQLGGEGTGKNCGMCVEVTYGGRSIIATVIDSCPSCTSDQDIDLSISAAKELGMNEMIGEVKSGARWRVVQCPTTSNIKVAFNGAPGSQMYFQNLAFPIAKASVGGADANNITGFWAFNGDVVGKEVTLIDVMGHTIKATIPAKADDLGVQFPLTCE